MVASMVREDTGQSMLQEALATRETEFEVEEAQGSFLSLLLLLLLLLTIASNPTAALASFHLVVQVKQA